MMNPEDFASNVAAVEDEIGRVIVGQESLVRSVMIGLLCEGHVLLEGVPGLGKTLLLRTLGDALAMEFGRVQFTPDLMPADIVGTNVLSEGRFAFHEGPIFANVVLADEVNRATPKTQSALLEAMQERQVSLGGTTHPLPRPFFVMATQNPLEMEGTYPLPEAQLDRFLLKVTVPFPAVGELVSILQRTTATEVVEVKPHTDPVTMQEMIGMVRQVPAASHVLEYAANLVTATHPDHPAALPIVKDYVRFGASPRGAQAMVLAGKARALIDGRLNLSGDDIRELAPASLRHRLVVGYEAVADGVETDRIIEAILDAHPAPTAGD
jgi:MoxR-like ATPase